MRQHASAYVSIRQHTESKLVACTASATPIPARREEVARLYYYHIICQHTSAFVSIRSLSSSHAIPAKREEVSSLHYYHSKPQHTSAYGMQYLRSARRCLVFTTTGQFAMPLATYGRFKKASAFAAVFSQKSVPGRPTCIRQHMSAYVSIRQHNMCSQTYTCSLRPHTQAA
jgi:hypothetical protein